MVTPLISVLSLSVFADCYPEVGGHRFKYIILLALFAPFVDPSLYLINEKARSLLSRYILYPIKVELARTNHPVSPDFQRYLI
jgi:hypothetical protein